MTLWFQLFNRSSHLLEESMGGFYLSLVTRSYPNRMRATVDSPMGYDTMGLFDGCSHLRSARKFHSIIIVQ